MSASPYKLEIYHECNNDPVLGTRCECVREVYGLGCALKYMKIYENTFKSSSTSKYVGYLNDKKTSLKEIEDIYYRYKRMKNSLPDGRRGRPRETPRTSRIGRRFR